MRLVLFKIDNVYNMAGRAIIKSDISSLQKRGRISHHCCPNFVGVDAWYTPLTFNGTSSQNPPECTHCLHICREGAWAQTFIPYHTDETTFDAILLRQSSATVCYRRRFSTEHCPQRLSPGSCSTSMWRMSPPKRK